MRSSRQFELLNEIARVATLDLELRPMLQRITDALSRKFDWPFVACVTVDAQRGCFVCEAVTSNLPTVIHPGYSRPLGSGVVGEVAATGKPILIDDVRTRDNYVETMPGARSELCVPVVHGGRLVAILNLESTTIGAFHDALPLLETVAGQLAGVIASAQRHEELVRRAALMEILAGVTRSALQEQEVQPMVRSLAGQLREQAGFEFVGVYLLAEGGDRLGIAASAGVDQEPRLELGQPPPAAGVVARCIRTGQAQLVLDTASDPDYVPIKSSVTSEYVVPVVHKDRLLGVLNLESASPAMFAPENLVVFRTLGDQLAGAIHLASLSARLAEANRKLAALSATDALTGVANRRGFDERLELEWRRAARARARVALLMFDVDHFKSYNDSYGHRAGDECLRRVVDAIQSHFLRSADLVARYGGEELAVLLPGITVGTAAALGDAARETVARLGIPHAGSPFGFVTVSAGASCLVPETDSSPSMLVEVADRMLYEAKRAGRNGVVAES